MNALLEWGVGVDLELIDRFVAPPLAAYTRTEIAQCRAQAEPAESFAGRWCAKEAVIKAVSKWARLSLRDVEVLADATGRPRAEIVGRLGAGRPVLRIEVSIAHGAGLAIAIATATPAERLGNTTEMAGLLSTAVLRERSSLRDMATRASAQSDPRSDQPAEGAQQIREGEQDT